MLARVKLEAKRLNAGKDEEAEGVKRITSYLGWLLGVAFMKHDNLDAKIVWLHELMWHLNGRNNKQ